MFSDHSALGAQYDTAHATGPSTERRHECELCGKKYVKKQALKLHMADVHGIGKLKTFQCDYCATAFKQKVHLQGHMKSMHKNFA